MIRTLLPLPVVLPLAAAAVALVAGSRRAQRAITAGALAVALIGVVALAARVIADADGVVAVQAGDWPAPVGIPLVADLLSAILLVVAFVVLLTVHWFATARAGSPATDGGPGDVAQESAGWTGFSPVYLVLAAGVALAFLTGDLFTLFVSFEIVLIASYVLLTYQGRLDQVRAGMTYAVVNLLGGLLFLVAIAAVYAATGTVNLADMAVRWAEVPEGLRSAISLLLLVTFGIKAAVFPLFSWLPDSYPTAPTAITAVFAALLTKIGVYAIIRTQTLLGAVGGDTGVSVLLIVVAVATMVIGVLGAVAQDDVKRILSFHAISQIGYMVFGLALFSVAGLTGAIFYLAHYIVVKTALFLVGGVMEQMTGTSALRRVGGLVRTAPVLAVLFGLAAASLAGIPPTSGFVAKLSLVQAGFSAGAGLAVAASLAVSLLTLLSMTKIWINAFWGDPPDPEPAVSIAPATTAVVGAVAAPPTVRAISTPPRAMLVPLGLLVVVSVGVAVGAEPLLALSERAAAQLLNPAAYVTEVLGTDLGTGTSTVGAVMGR